MSIDTGIEVRCGTYIQWNTTQTLKRMNNAIYSNMDGLGVLLSEARQIEKEKYMTSLACGI